MSNHTPRPWDYDKDSKEIFSCDEGHGCGWIALVGGNDSNGRCLPDEMRSANCSLIAAAPDLLAALREIYAEVTEDTAGLTRDDYESIVLTIRDVASAAITKAEGRDL